MTVSHHPDRNRFESQHEEPAYLEYETSGKTIDLTHTIVPAALEGKGVGSALVRAALDHAKENELKVMATCSFVQSWLERHPEYDEIVAE